MVVLRLPYGSRFFRNFSHHHRGQRIFQTARNGCTRFRGKHASSKFAQVTAELASENVSQRNFDGQISLESCVGKVREAFCLESLRESVALKEVVVKGVGRDMGMPITWENTWKSDGSFLFKLEGEHFSSQWGSADKTSSWEVDHTGLPKTHELDDNETTLLITWISTGQWLFPEVYDRLCVKLASQEDTEAFAENDASKGETGGSRKTKPEVGGESKQADEKLVCLEVMLKGGKVQVFVEIGPTTWLPVSIKQKVAGDLETWSFSSWTSAGQEPDWLLFPDRVDHIAASGGNHYFKATECSVVEEGDPSRFEGPEHMLLPSDTRFDASEDCTVKAWMTSGGHVLVRPKINGREVGYMILDTGASGFVIEANAAKELGLSSFGEVFVSGMAGKIRSQYRVADTFQLGPVTMDKPMFMEMPVLGLVKGKPRPLIGIIGYDLFRRAVVEMKSLELVEENSKEEEEEMLFGEAQPPPNFRVSLHDVRNYPVQGDVIPWQPLRMIAGLPHVDAKFSIGDYEIHNGMFMVDTGAGGAGVMFLSRAADDDGLQASLTKACKDKIYMNGVGGQAAQLVNGGKMDWFELSGRKHFNVMFLYIQSSHIDITVYSYGVICMLILARCQLILDYAHQRVAFVPLSETELDALEKHTLSSGVRSTSSK
ncbi:hypothetical protein BSKO_04251 [Bryopsis sp. KO-2023]|nr:hypothetical protein BSKO_04251 [Bryopsis sp. KO-2023]